MCLAFNHMVMKNIAYQNRIEIKEEKMRFNSDVAIALVVNGKFFCGIKKEGEIETAYSLNSARLFSPYDENIIVKLERSIRAKGYKVRRKEIVFCDNISEGNQASVPNIQRSVMDMRKVKKTLEKAIFTIETIKGYRVEAWCFPNEKSSSIQIVFRESSEPETVPRLFERLYDTTFVDSVAYGRSFNPGSKSYCDQVKKCSIDVLKWADKLTPRR